MNEVVVYIDPDKSALCEVFGQDNRTLREVRKLNTQKATILAKYLAIKYTST